MAWWQGSPAKTDFVRGHVAPRARLAELRNLDALYPDSGDAAYLLAHLFDVGVAQQTGMGATPLSSQELCAWQENSGVVLSPWEARTLRRLSVDFCNEQNRAGGHDVLSPWGDLEIVALKPEPEE